MISHGSQFTSQLQVTMHLLGLFCHELLAKLLHGEEETTESTARRLQANWDPWEPRGNSFRYPLVMTNIGKWPIEIDGLPIKNCYLPWLC